MPKVVLQRDLSIIPSKQTNRINKKFTSNGIQKGGNNLQPLEDVVYVVNNIRNSITKEQFNVFVAFIQWCDEESQNDNNKQFLQHIGFLEYTRTLGDVKEQGFKPWMIAILNNQSNMNIGVTFPFIDKVLRKNTNKWDYFIEHMASHMTEIQSILNLTLFHFQKFPIAMLIKRCLNKFIEVLRTLRMNENNFKSMYESVLIEFVQSPQLLSLAPNYSSFSSILDKSVKRAASAAGGSIVKHLMYQRQQKPKSSPTLKKGNIDSSKKKIK